MPLQPVDVAVDDEGLASFALDAQEFLVIDHAPALHRAQLLPDAVEVDARRGTDQPVQAAVDGVSLAFPGGAQPAGAVVHLEDLRAIAVHLPVAPGGQAGDAGPDDNDGFLFHGSRLFSKRSPPVRHVPANSLLLWIRRVSRGSFLLMWVWLRAARPPMAPRFIVSRAELGTMIIEPFSLRPSKSMFMPRRCMAPGLRLVLLGGLGEFLGDLRLGGAEDDSRLALALGLGLLGHRRLQVLGDDDVADLDGLDADAPGVGLLIEDLAQPAAQLAAMGEHVGQLVRADDVPQGRLGRQHDGQVEVLRLPGPPSWRPRPSRSRWRPR